MHTCEKQFLSCVILMTFPSFFQQGSSVRDTTLVCCYMNHQKYCELTCSSGIWKRGSSITLLNSFILSGLLPSALKALKSLARVAKDRGGGVFVILSGAI